jgi:hypothetical protein
MHTRRTWLIGFQGAWIGAQDKAEMRRHIHHMARYPPQEAHPRADPALSPHRSPYRAGGGAPTRGPMCHTRRRPAPGPIRP